MTEDAVFELLILECRVGTDGAVCYCNSNSNGRLHRVYGPAIEYPGGHREWWQDGRLHRVDGPAVEWVDGRCEWHINGTQLTLDGSKWRNSV